MLNDSQIEFSHSFFTSASLFVQSVSRIFISKLILRICRVEKVLIYC